MPNLDEQRRRRREDAEDARGLRRGASQADQWMRQYIASLPPEQRRQVLAAQQEQQEPPNAQPAARPVPQPQVARGQSMYGFGDFANAVGSYNAGMGNRLQGAANDVMSAIQNENESRVAQNREQRRLEHEMALERMRQETEQMKINALIQRLQPQQSQGLLGFELDKGTGQWRRL